MRRVLILSILWFSGCGVPDEGPWMYPGRDCLSCHVVGGEANPWSAAGTVFDAQGEGLEGVEIELADDDERVHRLTSNGAGNFYSAEAMRPPFRKVRLRYQGRDTGFVSHDVDAPVVGSCNACHRNSSSGAGRLVAP